MREVLRLFPAPAERRDRDDQGTTVVAFRTSVDLEGLLPSLRRLVED
ncbi:hypothetical protein [Actinoplanes sp. NPDC026623]